MVSLLTVAQVADRLQCSPSYVRSLMRAAEVNHQLGRGQRQADTIPPRLRPLMSMGFPRPIRFSKTGRMVRIPADELATWLQSSRSYTRHHQSNPSPT